MCCTHIHSGQYTESNIFGIMTILILEYTYYLRILFLNRHTLAPLCLIQFSNEYIFYSFRISDEPGTSTSQTEISERNDENEATLQFQQLKPIEEITEFMEDDMLVTDMEICVYTSSESDYCDDFESEDDFF